MTAKQGRKKLCNSQLYYHRSKEEWQDDFIEQYHKNKPSTAAMYNQTRKKGTPSWGAVAGLFEITKWLDWLSLCDIVPYIAKRQPRSGAAKSIPLIVTREFNVPGNQKWSDYLQEQFGTHRCRHN